MKRVFNIATMHFTSAMHLGYGVGDEYDKSLSMLYSDTLSSALCSVWANSGGDALSFLEGFRLSSAMPSYDGRLFMPLPHDKQCITVKGLDGMYKRLKRLQWIELPLWEILAREGELEITEHMISDCGTAILSDSGQGIVIMRRFVEQKVQVGLNGEDATPYFIDKIFFGPKVSLYALYTTNDDKAFRHAFELLADAGIGTSRSVGNGGFNVEFGKAEIEINTDANSSQLLSMWIPKEDECRPNVMSHSCYKMLLRGGYMAGAAKTSHRHLLKKNVYMIESGSTIADTTIEGQIVDLRPNDVACHPIWRDGRAFYLPFKTIEAYEM